MLNSYTVREILFLKVSKTVGHFELSSALDIGMERDKHPWASNLSDTSHDADECRQ